MPKWMLVVLALIVTAGIQPGCSTSHRDARPSAPATTPSGFAGQWVTVEPMVDPSSPAAGPLTLHLDVQDDGTWRATWTRVDDSVAINSTGTWKKETPALAVAKTNGSDVDGTMELMDSGRTMRMLGGEITFKLRRAK